MFSTDEWMGRTGDVWADEWRRTDRSHTNLSSALNPAILSVAPDAGRAIDLGCGAGETAITLATARPQLDVTGLDISPNLIAVATQRAAGIANLAFAVADTGAIDPNEKVDLFVSRHGVMFFADPVAAFTAIRAAAHPGARLVFSCFRDRAANRWAMLSDDLLGPAAASSGYVPGPFGFADRDMVAGILSRSGWTSADAQALDFDYIAGAGNDPVADAADFFTRIGPVARALAEQSADHRLALAEQLKDLLGPYAANGVVALPAAAWIWTAQAGETA